MGLISTTLPSDGTTGNAASVTNPLNAIIAVLNGNIESVNLANDSVTNSKIADEAITAAKMDPTSKFTFQVVGTVASAASITPDATKDMYTVTLLATNATINAPTGDVVDGQVLILRIQDNGVARTLTWNSVFRVIGVTLPTTTTANKFIYVGLKYNGGSAKWDVLSIARQA